MSLKLSTGLRNFLTGEGTFRKSFEDAVLNVYSGTAPTTVDEAPSGVLLCQITKANGTVTAGDRSTPQLYKITISGTPDVGDVVKLLLDSVAYNYTLVAADTTVTIVATKVARMLNDSAQVDAIATGADGILYVQSRIAGVVFTLTENTSTGITCTVAAEVTAAVRVNTIQFGAPAAGVISKSADVWSGVALATGTAGYFRLVRSTDAADYVLGSTLTVRLQGNVSTSGAELNMSSVNLVIGATQTIDTFAITEPAS